MNKPDYENVPKTLALGVALWTFWVLASVRAEVFDGLPWQEMASLAAFLTAFAIAVVTVDAGVREWVGQRGPAAAGLSVAGLVMAIASAIAWTDGRGPANPGDFPWPAILLLGVPMTSAALVTAARAAWRQLRGRRRSFSPPDSRFSPSRRRPA